MRRTRRLAAPAAALGIAVAAVLGLTACEGVDCPEGQHNEIVGYTNVWYPGTKVGNVTTPGHFSNTPNFACVEDR